MIEKGHPFYEWAYVKRCELVEKLVTNTFSDEREMMYGFSRHTPVMITNGPEGLNGSVKGFGFVPKAEFLEEITNSLFEVIAKGKEASGTERIKTIQTLIYSSEASARIDFTKLVSLELARKHTWGNVTSGNTKCTLVYYEPPAFSFEVRGEVEIHQDDLYSKYASAMHDIYHSESTQVKLIPAYLYNIESIFDNSVRCFGKQIL